MVHLHGIRERPIDFDHFDHFVSCLGLGLMMKTTCVCVCVCVCISFFALTSCYLLIFVKLPDCFIASFFVHPRRRL